ncbi:HET-domain-containing protein [Hypoxylon sp. NC0597]|nr:HET-domain-containing protein [Hypoxylon sp. NC0597]
MADYQYRPLPRKSCIRIVSIHPGNFEDDIIVSFRTSNFPRNVFPYEALSYVWGSKEDPKPVYVSRSDFATICASRRRHKIRHAKIMVTQNLAVALRHLRYADRPRTMWVDALCINQADDMEKGPQVAMMGKIYKLARRVVAWLGPEENDSGHAMNVMESLGAEVDVDFASLTLSPSESCTDPRLGDINVRLDFDEKECLSIYHLISRPWFDRLWIRQEIYVANSEAIMMCGLRQVKWEGFRRGLACVFMKPGVVVMPAVSSRIIFHVRTTLLDLRRYYRSSLCEDPRDRLYTPDYTKPYIDLYEQVTIRWIRYYGGLHIICGCELQNSSPYPSWVPDWSKPSTADSIAGSQAASSQLMAWYEFPRPRVLRVCYQIPHFGCSTRDLEKHYTIHDYARVLIRRNFTNAFDPPNYAWPNMSAAEQLVELMMPEDQFSWDDFQGSSACRKVLNIAAEIGGARLLQATCGYLGIGPRSAEPGDVVCCDRPLLLRPSGNNKFTLVGPCFVTDLGYGEALLGPLPENIRAVKIFRRDEDGINSGFKDVSMKSLPVDLTDFRRLLSQDPRSRTYVEPEVIWKRGVDLECFDIV